MYWNKTDSMPVDCQCNISTYVFI